MRKIYGLTIGGLQQKIFNLVLISIILIIAVFIGAAYFQTAKLTKVVGDARNGQQAAIKQVSEETMHQVVDGSMTKINALQAYIADDMFADVKSDVMTMQTLAAELFDNKDVLSPYPVYPPDKANEGSISSQVLCESGVDYRNSDYLKSLRICPQHLKQCIKIRASSVTAISVLPTVHFYVLMNMRQINLTKTAILSRFP